MNYIKQLEKRMAALEAQHRAVGEGIQDLKSYLYSSKFYDDTTVQVGDVLRRLGDAERAGWDAFCNAGGCDPAIKAEDWKWRNAPEEVTR
jgi:hypothetical protein